MKLASKAAVKKLPPKKQVATKQLATEPELKQPVPAPIPAPSPFPAQAASQAVPQSAGLPAAAELLIAISDKTFESGWGYFNKAQVEAMIHPSFVETNSKAVNPRNPAEIAVKSTQKGDETASSFKHTLQIASKIDLKWTPDEPVGEEADRFPEVVSSKEGPQDPLTFTDIMGEATENNNLVDAGIVEMAKGFVVKNPGVDVGAEILLHRQKGDHLTANSIERAAYLLQEEAKAASQTPQAGFAVAAPGMGPLVEGYAAAELLKAQAEQQQSIAQPVTAGLAAALPDGLLQKLPIPPELLKKRYVTPKYKFEEMTEVGHSFFIAGKSRKDVSSVVSNANRKFKPARFGALDKVENGVAGIRIWRIS